MIGIDESMPQKGKKYLRGQDVVWSQFNEVNFYVEDIEQENFYFEVLKKLFPDIKFEKIFPLGGKSLIYVDAAQNIENKKKIYIVDLDFDKILNKKKNLKNIFYLEKYSIENYLLDFEVIKKIIIEEKPRIKDNEIINLFDMNTFYDECKSLFSNLICYYLAIQKFELGIENTKCDTARFCNFNAKPACLKTQQLNNYHVQIEEALAIKNKRVKLNTQINNFKKYFRKMEDCLSNIPGKYLLNFIKYRIENIFEIPQMSLDSFTYRLAKNSEFEDLGYLKNCIANYIK